MSDFEPMEQESISYLIHEAHKNARLKGFWDSPRTEAEMLFLIITELCEAGEELRKPTEIPRHEILWKEIENKHLKPYGFPIEIADAVIRIFDLCGGMHIDLMQAIQVKMSYNKIREYKHGKLF